MNLVCKLFGHEFDDRSVAEEREHRPRATVLTVREIATCGRCGQERILSKNRGLIGPGSATGSDPDDPSGGTNTSQSPTHDPPAHRDSSSSYSTVGAISIGPEDNGAESSSDDAGNVSSDTTTPPSTDQTTEPEPSASDESDRPRSAEDEGVEIIGSPSATQDPSTAARPDTDESDPEEDDQPAPDASDSRPSTPSSSPSKKSAGIKHRCPECDFEVSMDSSPYMAGDICSNCRRGYIKRVGITGESDWERRMTEEALSVESGG